ncbi:PREDICTED: uncharacterized protein LOC108762645 [Trachymyrmex cornetzi]|uniref:uncharacterized protein LOC108762645 n=1 Tax=Trachymyrmex cornetzi TaxID=471704 RepID=UPI00084F0873|nr:PREDICTED: uncharacterized protein LOC108762645 [Trachymyrmex cornetzi]
MSKKKVQRSVWVRPIYTVEQRLLQEDSDNLVTMLITDPSLYFNYFRMQVDIFDKLFTLVGPKIVKECNIRKSILSRTRLEICIRYLASSDSIKSIGYAFRVAPNTVSKIVHETCNEIWKTLKNIVMPVASTQEWKTIGQNFERLWNFPHSIGAIDGRHMVIEAPPHSGSIYFNYKKISVSISSVFLMHIIVSF